MRCDPPDAAVLAEVLAEAVELARRSPPSPAAYAVGAVVIGPGPGAPRSVGWSRRHDPQDHAEEVALAAYPGDPSGGTLYSSLEPCSRRRSRRRTCTELILAAGIVRVVFALREPPLLADCDGAEQLARAGVEVVELPDLAGGVRAANAHLLG
jgi:diaminohydroxyphosphoribosylaminopyrimidine deaminase / 5-amino-6-(5-phosphoribosylamino)uracil reductase